jgi:hypothetical protein
VDPEILNFPSFSLRNSASDLCTLHFACCKNILEHKHEFSLKHHLYYTPLWIPARCYSDQNSCYCTLADDVGAPYILLHQFSSGPQLWKPLKISSMVESPEELDPKQRLQ